MSHRDEQVEPIPLRYEPAAPRSRGLWQAVRHPAAWTLVVFGVAGALWGAANAWVNHDNPLVSRNDPLFVISLATLAAGVLAFVVGMALLHYRPR